MMNRPQARWMVLVALAVLILGAAPGFAAQGPNPFGQPQVIVRSQPSYYVWVDGRGWHVRWSTPIPITLSGSIITDGRFSTVCPTAQRLPSGLSFSTPRRAVFTIPVGPGIGGFDFQTTGRAVTFDFGIAAIQGRIPPWLVYVGQSLFPSLRPFTLSVAPSFGAPGEGCREPHISDVERPNN
jgi:hypothetical protein